MKSVVCDKCGEHLRLTFAHKIFIVDILCGYLCPVCFNEMADKLTEWFTGRNKKHNVSCKIVKIQGDENG